MGCHAAGGLRGHQDGHHFGRHLGFYQELETVKKR